MTLKNPGDCYMKLSYSLVEVQGKEMTIKIKILPGKQEEQGGGRSKVTR